YDGAHYVVSGHVARCDHVPMDAAQVLGAPLGEGARFEVVRQLPDEPPFGLTVFTRTAEHTRRLMDGLQTGQELMAVVRLFVRPTGDGFRGFRIFRKKHGYVPFALVVDEILAPTLTRT